jgi:hypothetical protein
MRTVLTDLQIFCASKQYFYYFAILRTFIGVLSRVPTLVTCCLLCYPLHSRQRVVPIEFCTILHITEDEIAFNQAIRRSEV